MKQPYYAVIMAGGRGERFWPLSTSKCPKQLLDLVGDRALIAQAVERVKELIPVEQVFVITNEDLVEATQAVLPDVPPANIVGEPMGRDTAAAAALGCALVQKDHPDAAFCILTADQIMGDLDVFENTLKSSLELAIEEDVLVTIGIKPAHPDTGFGYIHAGEVQAERNGISFCPALKFEEKPDLTTARRYLADGNFFWNSGMFIWSVASLRKALGAHCPRLLEMMDAILPSVGTDEFNASVLREYEQLEKISIDYALMEKAENIVMAKGTFVWDDVGSWPALENHFDADAKGNVVIGDAEILDGRGNIVYSRDHLTALIGVEDLIVVQNKGVTLVCKKDSAQEIKKMVNALRARGDAGELL